MSITEFLLARIAEDEAEIGELAPPQRDESAGPNGIGWAEVGAINDVLLSSVARARAECAAKRRIVELHVANAADECDECKAADFPCPTVRAVEPVYADHPDYDPKWAL